MPLPEYATKADIARWLSVSRWTVYDLFKTGDRPAQDRLPDLAGNRIYPRSEVIRWAESHLIDRPDRYTEMSDLSPSPTQM